MTSRRAAVATLLGAALGAATMTSSEARRRGEPYVDYSYERGAYHGPYRAGYYGSEYGRVCDPEILGHITRYSCEYRN